MKITFCGDTHGQFHSVETLIESQQPDLIIQAGDFGIWPNDDDEIGHYYDYIQINPKNLPVYFCRGNHENHDVLDTFPDFKISNLKTGERIKQYSSTDYDVNISFPNADNIYLCNHGSILNLSNQNILFIGGADSIDKKWRIKNESWWPQEVLWESQRNEILQKIQDHSTKIDILVSHTCPSSIIPNFKNINYGHPDIVSDLLDIVLTNLKPNLWIFGHWHQRFDQTIDGTRFIGLNMCDPRYGFYNKEFYYTLEI